MTWAQQFAALAQLDGDEWDATYEQLEQDWQAAYSGAFIEIAVSRGWSRENASTWPDEIGGEAFIEAWRYGWDPRRVAEADVVACEDESPA